ncbi:MAG: MFS transporter [Rhodospirillales bacterium]|nr:MFS transporter [Rhodospirillales bacterium]
MVGSVIGNPALWDRDFHKLCGGSAGSSFGMGGWFVIMGMLVFEITQSSAWVGVSLAFFFLPNLVFGMLSGVVADWSDRRAMLRRVELAMLIGFFIFSALIAMWGTHLWLILSFSIIYGCVRATGQPARISYAYDVVGGEHIVAGLGLLSVGSRVGQLAGALVGGAAMHRYGTPIALLCMAAAHGIAFSLMSRLRSAGLAETIKQVPIGQNLRECIGEMGANPILLTLVLVTAVVEVFGFSFVTALPELATMRFGVSAEGLGQMHAARAVGGILAGLLLAGMANLHRRGAFYLVVICAFGGSLLLLSVLDQFVLALGALVIVAGLATATDVLSQSMMQLSVPNHLRGRAMGFWVFAIGSAPLGHIEMGALAVMLGADGALLVNGTMLIVVGILATVAVPRLKNL